MNYDDSIYPTGYEAQVQLGPGQKLWQVEIKYNDGTVTELVGVRSFDIVGEVFKIHGRIKGSEADGLVTLYVHSRNATVIKRPQK